MQGIFQAYPAKMRVGSVVFLILAFSVCLSLGAGPISAAVQAVFARGGNVYAVFANPTQ